jgi:hypothetical protein
MLPARSHESPHLECAFRLPLSLTTRAIVPRNDPDESAARAHTHGASAEPARGLEREPLQYCQAVPAVLRAVARKTPGGSARDYRLEHRVC